MHNFLHRHLSLQSFFLTQKTYVQQSILSAFQAQNASFAFFIMKNACKAFSGYSDGQNT
ncbi:unnamed protein product [Staurois parvus]|uniref:Uncharacterized protein n=1 Tax=Staurois parvus TaxID=386267 RepID=A0ABN9FSA7_9NEOB|nr:unnamed protein product [Staurois parvus]